MFHAIAPSAYGALVSYFSSILTTRDGTKRHDGNVTKSNKQNKRPVLSCRASFVFFFLFVVVVVVDSLNPGESTRHSSAVDFITGRASVRVAFICRWGRDFP